MTEQIHGSSPDGDTHRDAEMAVLTSEHTAGEWVFGSREGWRVDAPTHYSSHYTIVAKGRRAPIAFVVSTARDEDEYHANARLLRAAPKMLEALEKIEALGRDGEHSGDRHARCRDIARAAIAKAAEAS